MMSDDENEQSCYPFAKRMRKNKRKKNKIKNTAQSPQQQQQPQEKFKRSFIQTFFDEWEDTPTTEIEDEEEPAQGQVCFEESPPPLKRRRILTISTSPTTSATSKNKMFRNIFDIKDVLSIIVPYLSIFCMIKMRGVNKELKNEFDFDLNFSCQNYQLYFQCSNLSIYKLIKKEICDDLKHLSIWWLQCQNYKTSTFCFNVDVNKNDDTKSDNNNENNNEKNNGKYLLSFEYGSPNYLSCLNKWNGNNSKLIRKHRSVTSMNVSSSSCNDGSESSSLFSNLYIGNADSIPILKELYYQIVNIDNQISTQSFDIHFATVCNMCVSK